MDSPAAPSRRLPAGVHRLAPSLAPSSLAPPGAERETRRTFGGERETNFTLARRSR